MNHHSAKRPDGHTQRSCAILSAGAAFILFVFAMLLPLERYGEVIARNVAVRFWLLMVAGGLVQIAVLCALTAAIMRSLWFLPGRDMGIGRSPVEQTSSPRQGSDAKIDNSPPPVADAGNAALLFGVGSILIMVAFVAFIMLTGGK